MLCNCSMEWISFGFHGKRIFKFWAANRNWTEWEYSQPQHLASMLTYFSSRSSFNVNAYRKNSHSQSMNHLNALHSQQILHSWINIYVNRMHVWSSQRTKIACTFGLRLIWEVKKNESNFDLFVHSYFSKFRADIFIFCFCFELYRKMT